MAARDDGSTCTATRGIQLNNRAAWPICIAAVVVALLASAFGYHEHDVRDELRTQIVASELQPIATLLNENRALITALQTEPFTEPGVGILASYLAKIRRDGVPKHADMKQWLDALAENNTAIVTLIKTYAPHARTTAFTTEADKFRNYASAWRDRWNSVMELFMAGGNYPTSEIPFPRDFPDVVQAEIDAVTQTP